MASLELVNSDTHATVRLRPANQASVPFVRVVLSEFAAAAVACPLLLSKRLDTGAFYVGALLGFKPGECLIDSPDGRPAFSSLESAREGFFAIDDNIALDRALDRFASVDGESLFDGAGHPTAPLKAAHAALGQLMASEAATNAFIEKLLSHRLVEPIDVSLTFDDGEKLRLEGLYTVSLDALGELDDAAVLDLFRAGHIHFAYAMVTSLQHIALMARRRNERLASML